MEGGVGRRQEVGKEGGFGMGEGEWMERRYGKEKGVMIEG